MSGRTRTWTYTWNADDQLTTVSTPSNGTWRYVYDPLGRRVAKQRLSDNGSAGTEETWFAWDGFRVAEQSQTAADGHTSVLTWDYQPGEFTPVAQTHRTLAGPASQEEIDRQFFAIVTDLVGTPQELVTPDGELAWHTTTSVWGQPITAPDSRTDCPLRFPGQYHDAETGLDYNVNRYYDPATGRYLSPDPLGLSPSPNPIAYVDNPFLEIDPLGLAPCARGQWAEKADFSDPKTLAKKYDAHAPDFGITGNKNKANLTAFRESMKSHMTAEGTKIYRYNYRGQGPAVGFINPSDGRMVMLHADTGKFWSAYRLGDNQFTNIVDKGFLW